MIEDPLKDLNPKQREAVLEIREPLLVFAGPGTGKTKMLVSKAAYLIKEKGLKQKITV
jgi:superfamily I DNA/RNA helicase